MVSSCDSVRSTGCDEGAAVHATEYIMGEFEVFFYNLLMNNSFQHLKLQKKR